MVKMTDNATYWRGYVDSQDKKDPLTGLQMATAKRQRTLEPLARITGGKIQSYRSGFYITLTKLDKFLPKQLNNAYIRGWFDGQGQIYEDPLKLTVTGENAPVFVDLVKQKLNIELPKVMRPSRTSKSLRVTITGEKAEKLVSVLGL